MIADGHRTGALAEIDAALRLDPDFLAAHSLRDRIAAANASGAPDAPATTTPASREDGFAMFEERMRTRRAERCAAAARRALAAGRLRDAAASIDEIRDVKPDLPQLANLEALFDVAMSAPRRSARPGRWLTAGVAFASVLFAATMLERAGIDSGALLGYPIFPGHFAVAPLPGNGVLNAEELPANDLAAGDRIEIATVRPVATVLTTAASPSPAAAAAPPLPEPTAPVSTLGTFAMSSPAAPLPSEAPVPEPVAPPSVEPAVANVVNTPPGPAALPPVVDEERLVERALQRYRSAYEGLDPRSAQSVWPAVDERALARAFDDLASQALTFDACDVQVRGTTASAVCRGRMQYVTKVGSREPRVESRVWNFTLRKIGEAWQIATARAER